MTSKPLRNMRLLLLFLTSFVWIISSIDAIWSLSIDLAHHYALVARLTELWTVPYSGDLSLGEMNYYPRLSHVAAAVMGRLLCSAVLGMQTITVIAIVVLWASLIFILLSLPAKARLLAALGVCALLWLNRQYFHLDMHAGEVVTNFFYAQLVAQAFIVVMVAVSIHLEHIGFNPLLRYGLLGTAVYVAAAIHLLPALELLFVLAVLMAAELLCQVRAGTIGRASAVLAYLWVPAVGTALYLHPSMAVMSSLSNNDGGITGPIRSMSVLLAYSMVHLVGSACVLVAWFCLTPRQTRRQWLGLKYIGLYGLAAAGLCLMQLLALKLGHGSEYAAKKYVFALNTTALLEMVMLLAWVVYRRTPDEPQGPSPNLAQGLACVLAPALLLVSLYCVTPAQSRIQTASLVKLEQQLLLRRDLYLPSRPGKYDYLHGINNLHPIMTYMMSIGVLKAPRLTTQLVAPGSWKWGAVGTLITSENGEFDQNPACRRTAPSSGLVMLDGACLDQHPPSRRIIDFSVFHAPTPCVMQGWSDAEDFGTWTSDAKANLRCPMPKGLPDAQRIVVIDAVGFLTKVPAQRLFISIAGQPPINYRFDSAHPGHLIQLKLPPDASQEIQINFSLPDAKSPYDLGLSEDRRKLGLYIRTLEFK